MMGLNLDTNSFICQGTSIMRQLGTFSVFESLINWTTQKFYSIELFNSAGKTLYHI